METRMNNEDMQNEKENTPVKSGRLRLGRIQLLGLVVVVALIVIGLISRSNSQSDESVATVQKSLLETAEDALALNPQDSEAWYTKGVYLQTQVGDNQAAVESYSRAIEINAEYLAALFNRGLAYKSLGRLDKAIADFESVVELKNGEAPLALYNLGLIAIDEGDTELGDEYLQKAYELDPSLKP
jgi:tetratricopeptide (TPR) repeat protein